jgi:hypothetical protein
MGSWRIAGSIEQSSSTFLVRIVHRDLVTLQLKTAVDLRASNLDDRKRIGASARGLPFLNPANLSLITLSPITALSLRSSLLLSRGDELVNGERRGKRFHRETAK